MLNNAAEAFSGFVHRQRASTSSALEGLSGALNRSLSKLTGAGAKDQQAPNSVGVLEAFEKDAFTQEEIPDIFFVLERENNVIAKVDAAR